MSETMPAVPDDCEHHYEYRILGGQPIGVGICQFCHDPNWADLAEQAVRIYRWGHDEALAGKPARDQLSAYDMPRQDDQPVVQPSAPADPDLRDRAGERGEAADEVDVDSVTRRATQVVTSMGADIRALKHERDRYRLAWKSARRWANVLSAELTRRAPLLGEYAAEIERLRGELEIARKVDASDTERLSHLEGENARLRRMADDAQRAGKGNAEPAPACQGFQWLGQSFATCERCSQPAWEHPGEEVPIDRNELFGPVTVRPWEPGEADRMRAKWEPREQHADEAQQADDTTRASRLTSPGRVYPDAMADALTEGRRDMLTALADAIVAGAPDSDRGTVLCAAAEQIAARHPWIADVLRAHADQQAGESEPRTVAYRHADTGVLYCTGCNHYPAAGVPLTSADLPDGGACSCCHTDVLIEQAGEGGALKRAHLALAEQAGRDQAALARVRALHDSLAASSELTSPDDPITRGAAARRIAAALDGITS